jgi:hypothetical protein
VSIGTGKLPQTAFTGDLMLLVQALSGIALQSHEKAERFRARDGSGMFKAGLYYRFNVPNLDSIGLEEWKESSLVHRLTRGYINGPGSTIREARHQCVKQMVNSVQGKTLPSVTSGAMQTVIEDLS